MTTHHLTQAAHLVAELKQRGYRLTPQREMLFTALAASGKHHSAEELLKRVRRAYPRVNQSVVYRNLDLLSQLGLISRVDLGRGRIEYEVHHHPHHHHLVCRHCGRAMEVSSDAFAALQQQLLREHGFNADMDHLAIYGLCASCSTKTTPDNEHHPHSL
jgi:Fur family transcriptional regulator, ferric uptake regulator